MFYRSMIATAILAALGSASVMAASEFPPNPQQGPQQAVVQGQSQGAPGTQNSLPNGQLEWVSPAPQQQLSSQQQINAAFPQTNYGPANYPVQQPGQPFPTAANGQVVTTMPPQQGFAPQYAPQVAQGNLQGGHYPDDGTRGLFPPTQPTAGEIASEVVSPFTPAEIRNLHKQYDASRAAKSDKTLRAVPRISSVSVDLSPGSAMPITRVLPGTPGAVIFIDSTGAPWPIAAAPRVSDPDLFYVEWLRGTPAVMISTFSQYETGTLTVFLQGLPTPVVIQIATGEPDSKESTRVVDVRLDVRVPGRGPNAKSAVAGPGKIELYNDTLQAFLDGLPPSGAQVVKANGEVPAGTKVWQLDNELFVRTTYDIKSPFDQTSSAANGTRVYRMPVTPFVTFSDMGRSVTVQLDIL